MDILENTEETRVFTQKYDRKTEFLSPPNIGVLPFKHIPTALKLQTYRIQGSCPGPPERRPSWHRLPAVEHLWFPLYQTPS